MIEVSSLTTEYIRVPISARISGDLIDPTSYGVSFAVKLQGSGNPEVGDFAAGTWDVDDNVSPVVYYGQFLVATLAIGVYDLWVKIAASPETIIRKIGAVRST